MPETQRPPESQSRPLWRRLGHLLPRKLREQVYEPACYDRLRRVTQRPGGGTGRIVLYAVSAFLAVAGLNLPRVFLDGRRLSGLGKAVLVASLVLITLVYAVAISRYTYAVG